MRWDFSRGKRLEEVVCLRLMLFEYRQKVVQVVTLTGNELVEDARAAFGIDSGSKLYVSIVNV